MTTRCPFCGDPPPVDEYERVDGILVVLSAGYCCRDAAEADDADDTDADAFDDVDHVERMLAFAEGVR